MSNAKNVVNIIDAKEWARRWQTTCPNNCKAFLIPAIDLIEALKEMNVLVPVKGSENYTLNDIDNSGVRAYMAIDKNTKEGGGEKLLIVGTKTDSRGKHRDIIEGAIPGDSTDARDVTINTLLSSRIDSGVFDFTHPCPNDCDENSPLL